MNSDEKPDTRDEEFIFFQDCLNSLNAAWQIVNTLQAVEDANTTLRWAAWRMALVEYSRPYKTSYGIKIPKLVLPLPDLSAEDRLLHKRIIDLRDKVLAHSDLRVKDAKVYPSRMNTTLVPLIINNMPPPLPELDEFRGLIERTLDQLYPQIPEWHKKFEGD